jgi:hypothetical protein
MPFDFLDRQAADPGKDVGREAVVPGIQMLDDDEGCPNLWREVLEELDAMCVWVYGPTFACSS